MIPRFLKFAWKPNHLENNVKFLVNFAYNLWPWYKNGSHFFGKIWYKHGSTFKVSAARPYPNHTWVASPGLKYKWPPGRNLNNVNSAIFMGGFNISILLKMDMLILTCIFFTFNWLTLTSEMHFVKFHPNMKIRQKLFSGIPINFTFLSYLQNYKEFKAKILYLQPEKYGLSFDVLLPVEPWGMRMWSA